MAHAQLVWFKRDLRVRDHAPLYHAALAGPVICVYVYEYDVLAQPDAHASHVAFVNESLRELRAELQARGADLILRHGALPDVFDQLLAEQPFEAIWSHEETGNDATYQRDRRVRAWCRERGIAMHEIPQHGVIRRLRDRDGWARRWNERMSDAVLPAPERLTGVSLPAGDILAPSALPVAGAPRPGAVAGGELEAHSVLESFLTQRGHAYRKGMSSPVTAWEACSRLSPHFAWGTMSIRQTWHALEARRAELRADKKRPPGWLASLSSFAGRLHWHCHFMQKLEDEPRLEFENMARAYDGMRVEDESSPDFDHERLDAWHEGRTGYPMVDACMRALHAEGWINFRMRAMVMSFASYHLWLHWRPTALRLAQLFVDYEPGIHYTQAQMQSGVTGINTLRIYSPTKQVHDQDPEGVFLRRWIPELEGVPNEHIAEPHLMTAAEQSASGCRIGKDYPHPIVDHATATKEARAKISAIRRTPEARAEAEKIYEKHGSRKRPAKKPSARKRSAKAG